MTDTSRVLITENCRDLLGEVCLMDTLEPKDGCGSLDAALAQARDYGLIPEDLMTGNVVHRAPAENEPRALIFLEGTVEGYALPILIEKDPVDQRFYFREYRRIE